MSPSQLVAVIAEASATASSEDLAEEFGEAVADSSVAVVAVDISSALAAVAAYMLVDVAAA